MGYSDLKEAALDFKTWVGSITNPKLREKVNQMREFMLEQKEEIFALKEENTSLKKENADLKKRINDKDEMVPDGPYYWKVSETGEKDGPFCSKCFDDEEGKKIRLHAGSVQGWWDCPKCKISVKDGTYVKTNLSPRYKSVC